MNGANWHHRDGSLHEKILIAQSDGVSDTPKSGPSMAIGLRSLLAGQAGRCHTRCNVAHHFSRH
jgi:hypothetical protein